MSLESGREYSLEELKRLNTPAVYQEQPTQPLSAPLEIHPMPEEWCDLLTKLSALYCVTTAQNDLMKYQIELHSTTPTWKQASEMSEELVKIRRLLEQAGKEKERKRLHHRLRLPSIRISPAWLWPIPVLTALYALVSGFSALWTAFSTMLP